MSGRIFSIESVRSRQPGKGNILRLKVNFMPEIITLSKEVGCVCVYFILRMLCVAVVCQTLHVLIMIIAEEVVFWVCLFLLMITQLELRMDF